MKRSSGDITQSLNALQRRLQGLEGDVSEHLPQGNESASTRPEDLSIGDTVTIPHLNATGTVIILPDNKGELTIQAGIIKMKVLLSQVKISKPKEKKKTKPNSIDGLNWRIGE